jgi:hypothetical protein
MNSALALCFLLSWSTIAAAQSYGYAFIAAGNETGSSSYFHPGIGGDWILRERLGISGEVGAITKRRPGAPNLALLSGNGSFHFGGSNSAVDPFTTAGISALTSGSNIEPLWNWGGGANWWMRRRFGLRFEFRDHVWSTADRHLFEFRFGICFR